MMFSLINEPEKQQPQTFESITDDMYYSAKAAINSNAYSPIKYVINLFPNVCSQAQELAVDAMQSGL